MKTTPTESTNAAADASLAKLNLDLAKHISAYGKTKESAAVAITLCDQLLKMQPVQLAENEAFKEMLCRLVASVERRDVNDVRAALKQCRDDHYERILLHFGDDNPEVAEYLDMRPPEERGTCNEGGDASDLPQST